MDEQSFSHMSMSVSPPSKPDTGLSAEQIEHPNGTDSKTWMQKITTVRAFTVHTKKPSALI